jgi:hypothetical protein
VIIITKYSDFCKIIYKYKNAIDSQHDMVLKMFRAQKPSISYSNSALKAFYTGARQINGIRLEITSFSIQKSTSFFIRHVKENMITNLLLDFGIVSTNKNRFRILCEAMASYLKDLVENDDDAVSSSVKDFFNTIETDSRSDLNRIVDPGDFEYITEVNNKCPLSSHRLAEKINGRTTKMYKITKIYPIGLTSDEITLFNVIKPRPANLDSFDNNIALCPLCAQLYETSHDENTYRKLVLIKEKVSARKIAIETLEEMDVETSLSNVIDSLMGIRDRTILTPLSLDALKIKEKISENDICYDDVKNRAIQYFNYINAYFKKHEAATTGGSSQLGMNIKTMSDRLIELGESPSNIVDYIANDLNNRIHGNINSLRACEILVAYFVQHCEILSKEVPTHEVSE